MILNAGSARNNGTPSKGGNVSLSGGQGDKEPGSVTLIGGEKLDGAGGSVGGPVSLLGGNTPSGTGGSVSMTGGTVTSVAVGNVEGGRATVSGGSSDGTDTASEGVYIRSGRSTGVASSAISFFADDPQTSSSSTLNTESERLRISTFGNELTDNMALVADSNITTPSGYSSIVIPFIPLTAVEVGHIVYISPSASFLGSARVRPVGVGFAPRAIGVALQDSATYPFRIRVAIDGAFVSTNTSGVNVTAGTFMDPDESTGFLTLSGGTGDPQANSFCVSLQDVANGADGVFLMLRRG